MTKKILSVILVLVVFFGGYAVLPKKYNPLPVNDAFCATNYGGVYRVNRTFTICYTVIYRNMNGPYIVRLTKTYKRGQIITLTTKGYDSNNTRINLKAMIDNVNLYLLYR